MLTIPSWCSTYYHLTHSILKLVDDKGNDADLGEAVRRLVNGLKIPKQNQHMEFDKPTDNE